MVQPTVHPIVNAQERVFNQATRKWDFLAQPLTSDQLNVDHPFYSLLRMIALELRVHSYILAEGLNSQHDVDQLRDQLNTDGSVFDSTV